MKKRKLREDDYENINEDILLQKKVDDLTEKLEKQDKELYEAREKMAEAEYTSPSETTDANKFFEKVSTLIENKMKVFENRFDAMEKKMETNIESTKSYSRSCQNQIKQRKRRCHQLSRHCPCCKNRRNE